MPSLPRIAPRPLLAAVLLAAGFGAAAARAAEVDAQAVLLAPAGSEKELKASASLEVTALPAAQNQPVRKGDLLLAVDVSKLEAELAELRGTVDDAQKEQRDRVTDQGVVRGGGSTSGGQRSAGSRMEDLNLEQMDAMNEMVSLQGRITEAPVYAPEDGYVVRHLYAVGATTKKRKPAVVFVAADKTRLEATVAAGDAAPFAKGAKVKVASLIDPAQSFLGRVESALPAGEWVTLGIRPDGLPFLTLGTTTPVTLAPAP